MHHSDDSSPPANDYPSQTGFIVSPSSDPSSGEEFTFVCHLGRDSSQSASVFKTHLPQLALAVILLISG
jgi:hypothetical protein